MARLMVALVAVVCVVVFASPVYGLDNGLALLPPMGMRRHSRSRSCDISRNDRASEWLTMHWWLDYDRLVDLVH